MLDVDAPLDCIPLIFNVLCLRRTGFKPLTLSESTLIAADGLESCFFLGGGCWIWEGEQNQGQRAVSNKGRMIQDQRSRGRGREEGDWDGGGRGKRAFQMNDLFCCTDWHHFLCKKKNQDVDDNNNNFRLVVTRCLDTTRPGRQTSWFLSSVSLLLSLLFSSHHPNVPLRPCSSAALCLCFAIHSLRLSLSYQQSESQ